MHATHLLVFVSHGEAVFLAVWDVTVAKRDSGVTSISVRGLACMQQCCTVLVSALFAADPSEIAPAYGL